MVHPEPSFPELLATVVNAEGIPLTVEQIHKRFAEISERFKQAGRDNELWTTDATRSRAFWISVYGMFLEAFDEVPAGLDARLYEVFSDHANYALFDDVHPALASLHDDGVEMGLVSNFEDWLEVLLERLDVTRYFPVRIISGIEKMEKPDPALFELALLRAGVSAAESVYVGDSPHFDVAPAAAVGMYPVLLDRHDRWRSEDAGPGARIASLAELRDVLEMS